MSDLNAFAEQRVGKTLCAKYRLESLLGLGGMAAVYRGTHRNANRVAVKVLHPQLSINEDVRSRFLREGYVANTVDHPGAVRVLDDDTAEDGSVFLVMELLEGQTLDARWEKAGARLPMREVAELTHQLLDVLAAAHAKGIVHRDIKPENLFLTKDGVLKVLDFGIARLAEPSGARTATRTGRMLGTPAYMAPEQALGRSKQIDGQTDLWAAGATMFTLASGQFVHQAETVEEMLIFAGSRPARSLATAAADLPPAFVTVVDKALAFDKAERWADARAMEVAIESAFLEVFGARIAGARSRGVSADAFSNTAVAVTAVVAVAPAEEVVPPAAVAPAVTATQVAPAFSTSPLPRPDAPPPVVLSPLTGASTTAAIATERPIRARQTRPRLGAVLLACALVVMAAGGSFLAWRGGRQPSSSQAISPAGGANVATIAPAASAAVPSAASPPPPVASVSAPAPAASVSVIVPPKPFEDLAPTKPAVASPVPRSNAVQAGPVRPPAPASSARPPIAPPAIPTPNCDPPYTIDGAGRRVLKPGC